MPDLAVFYEHPQWFEPLFRELDRRGVDWAPIRIQDHTFDPADPRPPAPVILSRLAMSSFLRQDEHALFYSLAALGHWEGLGARVINGPRRAGLRPQQGAPAQPLPPARAGDPAHPRRPPPRGRSAPGRRGRLSGDGEGQRRRLRRRHDPLRQRRGARGRRRPTA